MAQGFPGFSAADMELLRLQDSFEKSQRLQGQGQGQGGQHSNGADFTTNRKHRGPRQGGKAYRILDGAQQSDVEREGTGCSDGQLEEGKVPVEKSVESSGLSQKANAGPDSPSDTFKYSLEEKLPSLRRKTLSPCSLEKAPETLPRYKEQSECQLCGE